VILAGEDFDASKFEAKRKASSMGVRIVEDGLDIETLEGTGTIALELLTFQKSLDILLIALGNGALINGIARVYKALSPSTKIVAVQSVGAPAMVESWKAGRIIIHERIHTIADGIGVRVPVQQALDDMNGLVDDALLVSDDTTIRGMQLLHRHLGIIAEPSGAVGIAAILENPGVFSGQTVGTIICGGNLTDEQIKKWILVN
jgi:threonine dehydratase